MKKFGITVSISCVSALGVSSVIVFSDRKVDVRPEMKILNLAERIKATLPVYEEVLTRTATLKDSVEVFCPKMGKKLSTKEFPTCRYSRTEIHAPLEEVTRLYLDHEMRKHWDKDICDNSSVSRNLDDEKLSINYLLGRPGYVFPPRDFVFIMSKIPGGIVGLNDYRSVAIISIDAADSLPKSSWAVRGNMNSVLILEPISAERTMATYFVEVNYQGWISSWMAEFSANNLATTLRNLKKELEGAVHAEDDSLSVEEAARLRFRRHQEYEAKRKVGDSIMDDVSASREDLQSVVSILEKRLRELRASESKDGLDLAELKRRVEKDLLKAKERLKSQRT